VYSGDSVDRSEHSVFESLPNGLPRTEAIPDLFLAPQADKPVSGRTWGLRFQYNCSTVRSASEFTILTQKPASSIWKEDQEAKCLRLKTPSGNVISLWNTTSAANSAHYNTQAYFEVGVSAPAANESESQFKYTGQHPGFETQVVFEYAAWQMRLNGLYNDSSLPFNATLEPSIQGLGSPFIKTENGTYVVNHAFFALKGDVIGYEYTNKTTDASRLMQLQRMFGGSSGALLDAAPAIGVRCVSSSDLGTADLDGATSAFSNFQRSSPDFNLSQGFYGALRFGRTAEKMLDGQFHQHYLSGDMPGATPGRYEESVRYASYLDPDSLLRSVNLAFALDASNLMYDINSGFKEEWLELALTSSREGKILSIASLIPGAGTGYFVFALFCSWAALSTGLGLWYGLRKRPTDKLDGYVMLRKGADMAAELKQNDDFMSGKPYHDSGTLATLEGSDLRTNS
jgi:hypothetical protein